MSVLNREGSNTSRTFILFSGFNTRAVLTLCRIFTKHKITFFIIALDQNDPINLTAYSSHVQWIREKRQLDLDEFIEAIEHIRKRCEVDKVTIVPSTEALNRFILDHRGFLKDKNISVPLVSKDLYELISNKYSFGELCAEKGMAIPNEIDLLARSESNYPIVAKPRSYSTTNAISPVIINHQSEMLEFQRLNNMDDFYFQEYVNGESYYLLYSIDKNGRVVSFSQKNYIQQGNGKSIVLAVSADIHNESIGEKYKQLFLELGYFGIVMVEIKRAADNDYMIEANPRFWGPLQLTMDCNVPIVELWLKMCGCELQEESKASPPYVDGEYLWLSGLLKSIKNNDVMYHVNPEVIQHLPDYLLSDVYLRKDSLNYFYDEIKGDK
ncbi:ATP-grasp domain-containing protein [Paenibacillus lautus]|uniref:ATP-grasp domain-containing protein n=1 Tax=Paenibacillus lautus TaxID=1401 RepID=UPI001C11C97B|nr:ATP-grasp domain-containing protein [Paenibacillus lautus]MBU5349298.1 ATP-grasp domain-containing protein [Paenibacillus lautus]